MVTTAFELLETLHSRGATVRADGDVLRIKPVRLVRDLDSDIRRLKPEILKVLSTQNRGEISEQNRKSGHFHGRNAADAADVSPDNALETNSNQAESTLPPHGVCPICHQSDGYVMEGCAKYFGCSEHQTKWLGDFDETDQWRQQTPQERREVIASLHGYQDVTGHPATRAATLLNSIAIIDTQSTLVEVNR